MVSDAYLRFVLIKIAYEVAHQRDRMRFEWSAKSKSNQDNDDDDGDARKSHVKNECTEKGRSREAKKNNPSEPQQHTKNKIPNNIFCYSARSVLFEHA